jgi:hypothetical protein
MDVSLKRLLASCTTAVAILAGHPTVALPQAHAQGDAQSFQYAPLTTDTPALQASLNRLFARSAAWRDAVDQLSQTGRRAYIVTPNRVRMIDPRTRRPTPFDADTLAEVLPVADEELRVEVVVVVVNLPLLEKMHREQGLIVDLEGDLDRILAHEVFGHAVPYLLAGHMSGRCPDPLPDQRAAESCVIGRENRVRAEMGFGHRTEYGLDGLALVRAARHRQAFR